jgi:hypothetical protein
VGFVTQAETYHNEQKVKVIWKEFFETLGNSDGSDKFDAQFKVEVEREVQEMGRQTYQQPPTELEGRITRGEIVRELKLIKSGKAAGKDGIVTELLKKGGEGMVDVLETIFNKVFEEEKIPEDWKIGMIFPIFKGGDPQDPSDYRGITLLSIVGKLFSRVINARLSKAMEKEKRIAEEQGGFRVGKSTQDQLFILNNVVADRMAKDLPTYLCFIDVKKAYDRVWQDGLLKQLWNFDIKGKMWRIIREMYKGTRSSVIVGNGATDEFDIKVGVKQGCVLSPLLYSIFIMGLVNEIKKLNIGIEVRNRMISLLLFADDIVMMAEDKDDLQKLVECLDKYSEKWRFEVNAKKSAIMVVGRKEEPRLEIGGNAIPVVDQYKYLGVVMNKNWNWKQHIQQLRQTAVERAGCYLV